MLYVGVDLHWRQATICVPDENGKRVKAATVRGPWSGIIAWLRKLGRPFKVCFGLVPLQDQSGPANRLGHITKQGPAVARRLLVEAAWQGIRRSEQLRRFFEQVMRGDPGRKKIAIVATAHHLVRAMAAMLSTGEVWREAA